MIPALRSDATPGPSKWRYSAVCLTAHRTMTTLRRLLCGVRLRRAAQQRAYECHSHSMVLGGLLETS